MSPRIYAAFTDQTIYGIGHTEHDALLSAHRWGCTGIINHPLNHLFEDCHSYNVLETTPELANNVIDGIVSRFEVSDDFIKHLE